MLMEAAARPVATKRPREVFIDEFEDSEAQESDGEQTVSSQWNYRVLMRE